MNHTASISYGSVIRPTVARRRPPQPLGEKARYFPYSASTPQSRTHESGLQLRVKLSTAHPNLPFRSGELVEGTIIIARPGGSTDRDNPVRIRSLTLNAYFESRTLFWHFSLVSPEKAKSKFGSPSAEDYELSIAHEVHRGLVPPENIELSWDDGRATVVYLDEVGLDGSTPQVALPFAFRLPLIMKVDEWNHYPDAPRDLCAVERCPPPSLPDSSAASIQWIAEAVLRLNTGPETVKVTVDERLFKLPSPSTLVTRVVFPVLPADAHAQDLTRLPFFGRDIRIDPFGAVISWEGDATGRLKGKEGDWRTYTKVTRLNTGKVMSSEVTLISELSTPSPPIIPRSLTSLPIHLSMRLESPSATSKSLISKRSIKEIIVTQAMITLKRDLSTRGGKDILPHLNPDTVRSEVLLPYVGIGAGGDGDSSSGTSDGRDGLVVKADGPKVEWDMKFELQTEDLMLEPGRSSTKRNIKASNLTPSFRTPNVQLEYVISLTILIDGHGEFFIATFPLQLLAGGSSELPSFSEAMGGEVDVVSHTESADPGLPPAYVELS